MYYFWDASYFYLVIPALLFAFYAQSRVRGAFEEYSRVRSSSGMTGSQAARAILNAAGLRGVRVERVGRVLADHYDPRARVLRLSPPVHDASSVAAIGVAAHEAGHALQDHLGYLPLRLRNGILPLAQLGSGAAWPLFLVGFLFNSPSLMDLGILLFLGAVLFQVITLPVEYNASQRALETLRATGLVAGREEEMVRRVLNAAALTYLAATAMALAQLARLLILRGRRD